MIKKYILEGLDCPGCAAKIEEAVKELPEVVTASCSVINTALTVEIKGRFNNEITDEIVRIVNIYEPGMNVIAADEVKSGGRSAAGIMLPTIGVLLFVAAVIINVFENNPVITLGNMSISASHIGAAAISPVVYFVSYLLLGYPVIFKAVRNIIRGQVFDENFLMTVATAGAFAIGEYPEAVVVMLFYLTGEYFQGRAVRRSKKSIAQLMDIRPDYANIQTSDGLVQVDPATVSVGDIITVLPGEKIPLDGIVTDGESFLDTKALTGEAVPRSVKASDPVLSGCINQSGVLTIEVTKSFGDSTVAKILDLIENAGSKKAPTENFITTFSGYYTPVVVALAVLIAAVPPLFFSGQWYEWIHRAMVLLVISCPCALVLSVPLSFFGGIGCASKHGILIKGGNYLEALNKLDIVVFDKTGTLTKGVFEVTSINPAEGFTQEELLEYAAYAEAFSNHPIAQSVTKAYGRSVPTERLKNYKETAGQGISVMFDGKEILAGNEVLMDAENIVFSQQDTTGTKIYVAVNKVFAGCIIISDEIKEDSRKTISALKKLGVRKTVMLTGDNEAGAASVGKELMIDEVRAQLLPADKVEVIEELSLNTQSGKKLAYAGDGINDAPVLARADVAIAMGALGSDAAIEASDIVLMTDEPSKLITAVRIAGKTRAVVMQNIIFALGVKGAFLILGALGISGMWEAVFADMGVSILAVFNALRVLRFKGE